MYGKLKGIHFLSSLCQSLAIIQKIQVMLVSGMIFTLKSRHNCKHLNYNFMKGGVILAAIAAFAYYKYSKLSEEQKRDLVNNLKQKGQKLYDQYIPQNLKNNFSEKA
jgi:hypothetical protein